MTKIAYLKCPTGIAGDMFLAALIDVGVPWDYLTESLAGLGISEEYQLQRKQVDRQSQTATKITVHLHHEASDTHHHHHPPARHLPQIEQLIQASQLSDRVKQWSLQIFQQLAIAEGAVHGVPPQEVHFHEVGATDAIVDIVGTCIGLDWLGIEELYCSALPTGGGTIKAAHGRLSVPVPAVLELWKLRQIPVYSNGIERELVTPTGAAIATTLAVAFGSPPAMTIEKIGLGAGSRDLAIPNILQLWIGNQTETDLGLQQETITVLETQIDDLNPQAIAYTGEQLLTAGALDVFTQGITMKKSRSGILLTVICEPKLADTCKKIIFQETTTLGIRERTQQRSILSRQFQTVETPYGKVAVKIARWDKSPDSAIVNIQPEYEDCANLARQYNIPWRTVQQAAISVISQNNS
jgi:uncharacterized protein (TIGR00299 family) protein